MNPNGTQVWHAVCSIVDAMNAFEMIARCAARQSGRDVRGRYEVGTHEEDSPESYSDLASALALARSLVEIGYRDVYVYDSRAEPGQPELWTWDAGAPGAGEWTTRVRRAPKPQED